MTSQLQKYGVGVEFQNGQNEDTYLLYQRVTD